jgi:hypothetical protein
MKNTYLKEPDRRALVDPQRLGQGVVDRGIVVVKFLPQRLLGLGLVEKGGRRAGTMQTCFGCETATSDAGGVVWDVDASVLCTRRCNIMQPSSRITSTSGARSGAGPDRPLD